MIYSREAVQLLGQAWLKQLLSKNVVSVTFTKANGERRDMQCTLRSDVAIPHEKKTERVKEVNESVVPAWDVNKNAWRSFRFAQVEQVELND